MDNFLWPSHRKRQKRTPSEYVFTTWHTVRQRLRSPLRLLGNCPKNISQLKSRHRGPSSANSDYWEHGNEPFSVEMVFSISDPHFPSLIKSNDIAQGGQGAVWQFLGIDTLMHANVGKHMKSILLDLLFAFDFFWRKCEKICW